MKVLMVCLGNICRSPLAEGILRHKVQQNGLNWEIDSAGTSAWHPGDPPHPRSVATAKKNGVDISAQRARHFVAEDFERFDLILAMDASNLGNIRRLAPDESYHKKTALILDFVHPQQNREVPDPYSGVLQDYEDVFVMLDEACEKIIYSA